MLSMTSDYAADTGCPEPYLGRIAEAGFTHVHWCHHWNTDFLYTTPEIDQIERWFEDFGLRLNDLHSSVGPEKNWGSRAEYERLAGVELVKNRMEMASRLGSDVIIMHLPSGGPEGDRKRAAYWERMWRSLDELEPVSRSAGVRIALENEPIEDIERVLARYSPEYVGLCYDSGHGNNRPVGSTTLSGRRGPVGSTTSSGQRGPGGSGLDWLERLKDRLISVHLHDNDGTGDQHNLLFSGTVDWDRLARIMAASSYRKPVSMEVTIRGSGYEDNEEEFLKKAFETGTTFAQMVENCRG